MVHPTRGERALILGAGGQLGRELVATAPPYMKVVACDRAALDITNASAITDVVQRAEPSLVINAAAFTAVDRAESEPERAMAVNARGAGLIATTANDVGARLVHISTDYVFDGARRLPYSPDDCPNPINVYGRTKLEGERRVLDATRGCALVVRTSWMYSRHGTNFVRTMLHLMREDRTELRVVSDQIGAPTWARSLARALWCASGRDDASGIHHWTGDGMASWHHFACAIQEEAIQLGLLSQAMPIVAIPTKEYPTAAKRPAFSVLDTSTACAVFGRRAEPWRTELRAALAELVT